MKFVILFALIYLSYKVITPNNDTYLDDQDNIEPGNDDFIEYEELDD